MSEAVSIGRFRFAGAAKGQRLALNAALLCFTTCGPLGGSEARDARAALGLDAKELAQIIGSSASEVQRYEKAGKLADQSVRLAILGLLRLAVRLVGAAKVERAT